MAVAYLSFVVGVVIIVAVGLLIMRRTPAPSARRDALAVRLHTVRDTVRDQFGAHLGALAILLSGAAAAVAICWPFGRMARRFEPNLDRPFLHFTQRHVRTHGAWHHINQVLTHMGNRPAIKIICIVAAVGFGILWRRRGFWIPALIMAVTFGFEKFGQAALSSAANRHKPALPDFGSYPSGGCARLITVYGMVFFLALLTWPSISRRWRILGWTTVGVLAFVEGYTRIYLIKHWGLDVVGGWLYGVLLLLALIAAASCFANPAGRPRAQRAVRDPGTRRDEAIAA